ncbi:MAG: type I restriction enzyme HsdR N-terminal domain-containing protein [Nostoc sp. ChiQUE01a]|nr:type I restriction enzyme HsdR N-terminal domain-containing protein [Nostoc sp. ChiQUE01a]
MMNTRENFSEEDIRTKIVANWLANHGFKPTDISVEFSFEIRLGRGIFRVGSDKSAPAVLRPRADVLVRSCDGRNLLIVEVKAPGEQVDDQAREQGISYARLLREGGIAPFVVVTNGYETRIYDSISGDSIDGTTIPVNHPHVRNGFRVSAHDLALRAEALETFISLSPENLMEFCRAQVSQRMRPLRSDDPYSGKKYIPALYIEREQAKKSLDKLLSEEKRRVVLLVGPPQVGKTNFVCHTVEERLAQEIPSLFYPAIGMQRGLLQEICEDFEWIIGDDSTCHQIINKLTRVLQRVNKKLVIFIDGWNEASQQLARAIDYGSERISCDEIQIVLSMTNVAASRLLLDNAGNPSHVAEAASIPGSAVSLLEISPEEAGKDWSVVTLMKYVPKEIKQAYQTYAEVFKVKVPDGHRQVDDPFLLRIGMELFQGQSLPESLDEPTLLEQSIYLKASRTLDLERNCVPVYLSELADEMFSHDAPVSLVVAAKRWGLPIVKELPKGLFEAALLAKVRDNRNLPALDFYYGRERDFVVACWVCQWYQKLLQDEETILKELSAAVNTQVGTEALRWFLAQPSYQNCLQLAASLLSSYTDFKVKRILLSSIRENISRSFSNNDDWVLDAIEQGARDTNILVKVEAAKLAAEFTEDQEWVASIVLAHEEFIANLLEIEREYPLGQDSVGWIILDAIRQLHWDSCTEDNEDSEITEILRNLINHYSKLIRIGSAKCFGYIAPKLFLRMLYDQITSGNMGRYKEYIGGIELAIKQLWEIYGGSYGCPGYLDILSESPEDVREEHSRMYNICYPIINFYSSEECSQNLLDILRSLRLKPYSLKGDNFNYISCVFPDTQEIISGSIYDVNTFAHFAPKDFLKALSAIISSNLGTEQDKKIYKKSIEIAIIELNEIYFDYKKISQLSSTNKNFELLYKEYKDIYNICIPLIKFYNQEKLSQNILALLNRFLNIINSFQSNWNLK